jgi:hypothetical protein
MSNNIRINGLTPRQLGTLATVYTCGSRFMRVPAPIAAKYGSKEHIVSIGDQGTTNQLLAKGLIVERPGVRNVAYTLTAAGHAALGGTQGC